MNRSRRKEDGTKSGAAHALHATRFEIAMHFMKSHMPLLREGDIGGSAMHFIIKGMHDKPAYSQSVKNHVYFFGYIPQKDGKMVRRVAGIRFTYGIRNFGWQTLPMELLTADAARRRYAADLAGSHAKDTIRLPR